MPSEGPRVDARSFSPAQPWRLVTLLTDDMAADTSDKIAGSLRSVNGRVRQRKGMRITEVGYRAVMKSNTFGVEAGWVSITNTKLVQHGHATRHMPGSPGRDLQIASPGFPKNSIYQYRSFIYFCLHRTQRMVSG